MKDSSKVLCLSYAFLFFYLFLGIYNFFGFGLVNASKDFYVHWNKLFDFGFSVGYPSGYHFLFQVFNSSQLLFYGANVVLVCFLIPILLFVVTKTWWSTVLYFCGVSLPHVWLYGSTFPQTLIFVLILIYLLNRKNVLIFGLMGLLAFFIHNKGLLLFGLVLFAEIVEWYHKKYLNKRFVPIVILGVQKFGNIFDYVGYLLVQISIPIWFFAINLYENIFLLILSVIPLFLLWKDPRILSVTQLALILFVSPKMAVSKHKKIIIFTLFLYLIFFLLEFGAGTTKLLLP